MASVKFEKGSPEWYMFQEYWKLCQKFWITENNDEYWDQMNVDIREFMKKYSGIDLSKNLAIAFLNTMDNRYRIDGTEK